MIEILNGAKYSKILSMIFISLSIIIIVIIILSLLSEPTFFNITIIKSDISEEITDLDIENIKEGKYYVNFSDLTSLRKYLEKNGWTFKEQKEDEFLFIKYKKNEP